MGVNVSVCMWVSHACTHACNVTYDASMHIYTRTHTHTHTHTHTQTRACTQTRTFSKAGSLLQGHCVKTDESVGLTQQDCLAALNILRAPFDTQGWLLRWKELKNDDDDGVEFVGDLEGDELEMDRDFFLKG